jgi:branched-chain amino acid transport system ATP-binding protein
MEKILETNKIVKNFGALRAVSEVDFHLAKGEILGLIGPNGAGKSTLLNIVAGIIQPTSGEILFKGKNITGKRSHSLCKLGIVKTSQIVQPFTQLTLFQNIYLAAIFGGRETSVKATDTANKLLEFTKLFHLKNNLANELSVPQRRRLEFARALATSPEILLLDENMAGLTPKEIDDSLQLIREINSRGISIIIVEHIMRAVKGVSHRIVVLNYGEKIADGEPDKVLENEEVQKAYFGD